MMVDRTIHIPEVKVDKLDEIEEFLDSSLVRKYEIMFEQEMRAQSMRFVIRDLRHKHITSDEHDVVSHLSQLGIDHNLTYTHTF